MVSNKEKVILVVTLAIGLAAVVVGSRLSTGEHKGEASEHATPTDNDGESGAALAPGKLSDTSAHNEATPVPPLPTRITRSEGELNDSKVVLTADELRERSPLVMQRVQEGLNGENRDRFRECVASASQRIGGEVRERTVVDARFALTIATTEEVGRVESVEVLEQSPQLAEGDIDCFRQVFSEITFDAADTDFSGTIEYPIRAIVPPRGG